MKNVFAISSILLCVLVVMVALIGCKPKPEPVYPIEIIRIFKSKGAPPTGGWAMPLSEIHPYPTGIQEIFGPGDKMFLGLRLGQRLKSVIKFSKYTFFNRSTGTETETGFLPEDLGSFTPGAIVAVAIQHPWSVPSEPGIYELRVYLGEKIVSSAVFEVR